MKNFRRRHGKRLPSGLEPLKVVPVQLEPAMIHRLDSIAADRGIGRSTLIREILDRAA